VALAVAVGPGVDTLLAAVLPQGKVGKLQDVKRAGARVGMVGRWGERRRTPPGPARVSPSVEVAVGAGDNRADGRRPRDVRGIVRLSRASYRQMGRSLWWPRTTTSSLCPLAAGVPASRGCSALSTHRCGADVAQHGHSARDCPATSAISHLRGTPACLGESAIFSHHG
jgi:cation transport ATPase